MKLTVLLISFVFSTIGAKVVAQKVDLNIKNGSLETILKEIKNQTGLLYWCDQHAVADVGTLDVKLHDVEVGFALHSILDEHKLSFVINDSIIVITPEKNSLPADTTHLSYTIHGIVTTADGKKEIANVSIYIANTTIGTSTNSNGEFTLAHIPRGKYSLVFSSVGYLTYVEALDTRVLRDFYKIVMQSKAAELAEVTIRGGSETDTWRKWGAFFSNNFIGSSALAKHCQLMNKDAVHFHYSKKYNRLTATADVLLIFENKSLGYEVRVNLERFIYDFNNRSLQFEIYPLFMDMKGYSKDRKRWAANRREAYYGSPMHFFRALYKGNWSDEGFVVQEIGRPDSMMVRKVKRNLRSLMVKQVDSTGRMLGYQPNDDNKNAIDSCERWLTQNPFKHGLEYPGQVSFSQLASYTKDSASMMLDFDLSMRVTYLCKTMPPEYFQDEDIDNSNPSSGRMVPIVRFAPYGISTRIELLRGIPVEVFPNGSYHNDDLMFFDYWAWWQKICTMLPYNYDPKESVQK